MGVPLFQLVARHLKDPAAFKASLKEPALVWEGPPLHEEPQGDDASPFDSLPTVVGRHDHAVQSGEVRIFFVKKDASLANAFPMGVTIGRLATNDIVLDDASVSRFHAFLQQDAKTQRWTLTDAGSDNGTAVDGKRLAPKAGQELPADARVSFGDATLIFMTPAGLARYVERKATGP
jgi:hypothetical protein